MRLAQEPVRKFGRPLAVVGIAVALIAAATTAYLLTRPQVWEKTTLGGEETYFLCPGPDDGTEEYAQFLRQIHNETGCKGWGVTGQLRTNPRGQPSRVVWSLDLADFAGDHVWFVFGQWCGPPCNNTLGYDENKFRTGIHPVYAELLTSTDPYTSALSGEVELESLDVVFEWQNRNYLSGDQDLMSKPLLIRTVIDVYTRPSSGSFLEVKLEPSLVLVAFLALASIAVTVSLVYLSRRARHAK